MNFLEEARTCHLEDKGVDISMFTEKRFLYAVRKCSIEYKYPARYGDTIICNSKITSISAAQMTFYQEIKNKNTDKIILEADVNIVSLNKDFKPTPIPEEIRSKLT